jgi:hypothetical protein
MTRKALGDLAPRRSQRRGLLCEPTASTSPPGPLSQRELQHLLEQSRRHQLGGLSRGLRLEGVSSFRGRTRQVYLQQPSWNMDGGEPRFYNLRSRHRQPVPIPAHVLRTKRARPGSTRGRTQRQRLTRTGYVAGYFNVLGGQPEFDCASSCLRRPGGSTRDFDKQPLSRLPEGRGKSYSSTDQRGVDGLDFLGRQRTRRVTEFTKVFRLTGYYREQRSAFTLTCGMETQRVLRCATTTGSIAAIGMGRHPDRTTTTPITAFLYVRLSLRR